MPGLTDDFVRPEPVIPKSYAYDMVFGSAPTYQDNYWNT